MKVMSADSEPETAQADANFLARPASVVMEENIRLRQAINDVVLTNQRWLRYNHEQAAYVKLLLERLKESEEERQKLHRETEALKIQVKKAYERESENCEKERLEANQQQENARRLIRQLQEENWLLRSRYSSGLVCRGPSDNHPPTNSQPLPFSPFKTSS